ncbi:AAEL004989-PA [Aedes aegypti]|uniref:AAEL004989-PA n=1 Tax=Aedes aegypti TaxID=7159 RepID=Q17BF0_AEDAE|nr:AAEL004989-PA [Aedes aegypti]
MTGTEATTVDDQSNYSRDRLLCAGKEMHKRCLQQYGRYLPGNGPPKPQNPGYFRERHYRRYSRSRSRSYSRERYISGNNRRSPERDLYRDLIDQDYGDNSYDNRDRDRYRHRSRDRERRSRDRDRRDRDKPNKRGYSPVQNSNEFDDNYDSDNNQEFFYHQKPNNKIIVRGLAAHITEADINSDLIQCGLQALHVRLIRRKKTGASRGFAFVEFRTEEEATRWICYKQCGVFNFKRRENCFKCFASREESEKGGEGSDEISNILTKKIMLRNLDVLTNEESVLCAMQDKIPDLVSKISKIMICRDPLTQTSRGICYLHFDNLLDSMNTHNALKSIEPILKIDGREVLISYCMDTENRNLVKGGPRMSSNNGNNYQDQLAGNSGVQGPYPNNYQYTMADVPRLAEYSASVYASNPVEHEHYLQFYTNYYVTQISQGQMSNFPTEAQMGETANSGAAVAQSALARKQGSKNKAETSTAPAATLPAPQPLQIPNGTDGKTYATPDVSQYQYDETSGFYYDPSTGLYYDSNSQYYYNNETCSYLYWDNEKSTYVLAPTASTTAATTASTATETSTAESAAAAAANANGDKAEKTKSKDQPQDKVKVAKKIVKDMEKWAKQLNQKKDYSVIQPPARVEEATLYSSLGQISARPVESSGGYADVGFSLLEKKQSTQAVSNFLMGQAKTAATKGSNALVSSYNSDSDNECDDGIGEREYVDFEKLTCLLCKRAFQSQEILNKHLKMSSLHKENLQKLRKGVDTSGGMVNKGGAYRDRAKERRLKYGEVDPPPVNKSKERFQRELEKQTQASYSAPNLAAVPIGQNNVGNKLLQKMGWSEGQGLGRSNQGRTNIIETETRVANVGLGIKAAHYGATGDDYKTYIKKMMKARYEQADVKD